MPRKTRCSQKALCYHVMNRGLNQQDVFADDQDRVRFGQLVVEYKIACDVSVYHWVWMSNHYHLLIEVTYDNLRPFMSGIQQSYAQYHHARHGTSGRFWQGRFKSKPVELDGYLMRCARYIERNPVRATMVSDAHDYRWSSASCYVTSIDDEITDWNPYMGASRGDKAFELWYGRELAKGDDDDLLKAVGRRRCIGSEDFSRRLRVQQGRHRRKQGRPAKPSGA